MGVAFRYLSKELLSVFIVTTLILLIVGIGGRFIGYLQEAVLGKYSADVLVTLISLRLPEFLQLCIPFAYFLAVILTASRWYADHEMTAIIAGGASPGRIAMWVMVIGLVLSSIVAGLSLFVTPNASRALEEVFIKQRAAREFEGITPGVFHNFSRGRRVTYSESMSDDKAELFEVFLSEQRSSGAEVSIWAEKGTQYFDSATGSRFLLLENGLRYEGFPGTSEYRIVEFEKLSQRIESSKLEARKQEIEALPTSLLLNSQEPQTQAELHWRVSLPFMTLIAGLCGFAVSRVKPRSGRFARIMPGLLVIISYYLLLLVTRQALSSSELPMQVGYWPVHLLFLIGAGVVLMRSAKPASSA